MMPTHNQIVEPESLQEWLSNNQEFIDGLKDKELTNQDTQDFYNKLRESNIFGEKILIRIEYAEKLGSGNFLIIARVVEPTERGFRVCKDPLGKDSLGWKVSTLSKTELSLLPNELYESTYAPEGFRDKKRQLITFDVNQLEKVDLTASQHLQQVGGTSLAKVASDLYGEELDVVLFSRLFSFYEDDFKASFQSVEDRKEALRLSSLEVQEEERRVATRADELRSAEKELKMSHRKELMTMNRSHQQALKKMSAREKLLYDILSDIRTSDSNLSEEEQEMSIHPWDVATNVTTMQRLFYHNSGQTLYYNKNIIEMFLRSLQTNTLSILSGPLGTGKSSLIAAFAQALQSSSASIIPVQSSWTDNQDLLGYFNTIERRYVPTPFLEAMLAARESDGLHLICLDEMNLSHIEYYFAELLSAREQGGRINLYPDRYRVEAIETIEEYGSIDSPSRDDRERYRNAIELLKYPSRLDIPENVRFVGTINMDHTVKPLSPKVIDRSFIIELSYQRPTLEQIDDLESHPTTGKIAFSLSEFSDNHLSVAEIIDDSRWLVNLSDKLDIIPDAKINSRSERQIAGYLQVGPYSTDDTLDQLIQSKLLPRIHFSSNNEEAMAVCETFLSELQSRKLTSSIERFERMRKGGRYISYFK